VAGGTDPVWGARESVRLARLIEALR